MYTEPWYLALKLQILITIVAMLVGKTIFRLKWVPLIFAGLLCFSVPIAQPPGFLTWLLPMDLAMPLILLFSFRGPSLTERRLVIFFLIILFFWPFVTAMHYVLTESLGFNWVASLWRKLLKVSLFIFGLRWGYHRLKAKEFMDAVAIIWIGMMVVGIVQIFGMLDVDFHSPHAGMLSKLSIMTSGETAQRGFLGLDHGSVGLFGAGLSAYYLIFLLGNYKTNLKNVLLYVVTITLSFFVVFISGSRTGLIACLSGVIYTGYYLVRLRQFNKIICSLFIGCIIAMMAVFLFKPVLLSGSGRFMEMKHIEELGSWQFRVRMWKRTIEYVITQPRAIIFGLGEGSQGVAGKAIGVGAAHNEFLQNLINTGIVGFFLYISMLVTIYIKLGSRRGDASPKLPPNKLRASVAAPELHPESEGMRAAMVTGLVCALTVAFLTNTTLKKMSYSCVFFLGTGALIAEINLYRIRFKNVLSYNNLLKRKWK